jgi:hypothetical protein
LYDHSPSLTQALPLVAERGARAASCPQPVEACALKTDPRMGSFFFAYNHTFLTYPHQDRTSISHQLQPTAIVIAGILGHQPVFSVFYLYFLIVYCDFLKIMLCCCKLPLIVIIQPVFALFSFSFFFNLIY